MEVYINDMLVKSKDETNHVEDIRATFDILRQFWMKLNLLKCAFGVEYGKFLGFMVNQRRIEANPKKFKPL